MADKSALETVRRINRAWPAGDAEALAAAFAPGAVIVQPGWQQRVEGRDACVASYLAFADQVRVEHLEAFDEQADVAGDTAVVTYGFSLTYEADGEFHTDGGRDVFVLVRANGDTGSTGSTGGDPSWQVVWRTLVSEPA